MFPPGSPERLSRFDSFKIRKHVQKAPTSKLASKLFSVTLYFFGLMRTKDRVKREAFFSSVRY